MTAKYLKAHFKREFQPLMQSSSVQAAVLCLKPGKSSSSQIEDEHPLAEQWLFVVSGTGLAKVRKQRIRLAAGTILYIPKRAPHQITNTGRRVLQTLNFYSPPAYFRDGNVLTSVKK